MNLTEESQSEGVSCARRGRPGRKASEGWGSGDARRTSQLGEALAGLLNVRNGDRQMTKTSARLLVPVGIALEISVVLRAVVLRVRGKGKEEGVSGDRPSHLDKNVRE